MNDNRYATLLYAAIMLGLIVLAFAGALLTSL
jgi:hypothetical protein